MPQKPRDTSLKKSDPHSATVNQIDYSPVIAGQNLEHSTRQLIRLAIHEDLGDALDWTTVCLIEPDQEGQCNVVAREQGVSSGMVMIPWV
ncbi:MAG: hypothetical protein ACPHL6_05015, partial [Rubripirellula sp.]